MTLIHLILMLMTVHADVGLKCEDHRCEYRCAEYSNDKCKSEIKTLVPQACGEVSDFKCHAVVPPHVLVDAVVCDPNNPSDCKKTKVNAPPPPEKMICGFTSKCSAPCDPNPAKKCSENGCPSGSRIVKSTVSFVDKNGNITLREADNALPFCLSNSDNAADAAGDNAKKAQ